MQHLVVKKPLLYSAPSAFFSSIRRLLSTSLSSPHAVAPNPPVNSSFAVEYLVKSCGIQLDKAIKLSKYISHLESPSKPDSVVRFLRESGVTDAGIQRAISADARLLCINLEKTMKPRVTEMQKIGFTPSQIDQLISLCPHTVRSISSGLLQKRIEFLMPFLGSMEGILRALKKTSYLLTASPEKVIGPNISFLQENYGVSPNQIGKMIATAPSLFTIKPDTLDAKIKNLKNIGFSKVEIESMIKKYPMLLANSDDKTRSNIGFLTTEAGIDLPYIAGHPALMSYSLEKRIIPRYYVLKSLESKALCKNFHFYNAMCLTDQRFDDKFVRPYKDIIAEVCEAFEAACAGKISLKGRFLYTPRKLVQPL